MDAETCSTILHVSASVKPSLHYTIVKYADYFTDTGGISMTQVHLKT